MQVIEPLKCALVDRKNKPDYAQLQVANRRIQELALEKCKQWYNSVSQMCDEIKKSPAWKQAEELAERIEELQTRARQHGWSKATDGAYETRIGKHSEIFDAIEGPDKAIAYLEDWCQKVEI